MEENSNVISTNSISNSIPDKLGVNALTDIKSPFK